MTQEKFNEYAEQFAKNCSDILSSRATQYQVKTDPLYNFNVGSLINGLTPTQTCWAYMSKHLAALKKKVAEMDIKDDGDWLEKCTDVANYAKLLYICAMDARDEEKAQEVKYGNQSEGWIL